MAKLFGFPIIKKIKMQQKKILSKDVLVLTILTTICVVSWIVFDIYRALKKSDISQVLKEQLNPLNPNFDKNTLESLKQRKIISEAELDSVPELTKFKLSEKQASPSATSQASPSAIPNL